MLPLVHTITIALHILFAAAWFGLSLSLPALARAQMSGGAPGADKVMTSLNGSAVLFYVFAVANWMIGLSSGFEAQYNAWPYHTSMTLGLILVAVQLFVIRPSWNKLVHGDAEAGRKRMAMGTGIGHAVWLTIFVLMYLGRGVVAG